MWLRPLIAALKDINAQLARIEQKETDIMGAIEDLEAIDTDLAAGVKDLSSGVDRIDAHVVELEAAVAAGGSTDPRIAAVVADLRSTLDQVKHAKAAIDTTDPAPAPPAAGSTPTA